MRGIVIDIAGLPSPAVAAQRRRRLTYAPPAWPTLVCEARIKEQTGPNPLLGIVFGMRGEFDYFTFSVGDNSWRQARRTEAGRQSDLQSYSFKRLSRNYNNADWHTYRIEVDGKRVRCSMDDRELWTFSGSDRELDGHPGLWVRDVEIEVRSFTFEQAE